METHTTELLAKKLGILPQSIRSRVCKTGSYFGITPQKLANGRLLWPANSLDLLKGNNSAGGSHD